MSQYGWIKAKNLNLNHVYLETYSSFMMKRICPHPPTPSPNFGIRGENFKVPLSNLGEGFRERVKTTVLNLDKVYNLKLQITN